MGEITSQIKNVIIDGDFVILTNEEEGVLWYSIDYGTFFPQWADKITIENGLIISHIGKRVRASTLDLKEHTTHARSIIREGKLIKITHPPHEDLCMYYTPDLKNNSSWGEYVSGTLLPDGSMEIVEGKIL